jgi:hypothetical protein
VCRSGDRHRELVTAREPTSSASTTKQCGSRVWQTSLQPMSRKRYVGSIPHLYGKTALVRPREGAPSQVMAQFEERHLQEARGWWQFCEADFLAG